MNVMDPAAPFRDTLTAEICYALGGSRSGALYRLLAPLLRRPLGRLARIAARADAESEVSGLPGAARRILPDFSLRPTARGAERIPPAGPLLMAANHPGGLDSLAVLAAFPRRDVKVVISDSPLTRAFKSAGDFFIHAPLSAAGGASALRACIRHLRGGGAVLMFPNGDVEPDPELGGTGDSPFREWSRSIEVLLREAPETRLQAAIISGVLKPAYLRSPLVRIRKTPVRRQKLAEVLQILRQTISPGAVRLHPHLSYAEPVGAESWEPSARLAGVIGIARRLLDEHRAALAQGQARIDEVFRPL